MQVVFHAAMEEERGRFTFEDVCRNVCEKLVFRINRSADIEDLVFTLALESWATAVLPVVDRMPSGL